MAVNLGKVGFVLKGEWSAVVTYDPLEVVLHEGKVYAAKRSSTNAQPDSNPADWMKWVGSPVITSSAITGGHAITITNADGTSETINVLDGEVTNEVLSETLNELIGNLANLTTTDKSNVVAAINELDSDVGELQEGMETKAEIDGYYEDLTAGSAEQLISSVAIPDNAPYNFRTSGGNVDIGNRETDKLVGGTVAWNQLVSSVRNNTTVNGLIFTNNFPKLHIEGTCESETFYTISGQYSEVKDHVYLLMIGIPKTNTYWIYGGSTYPVGSMGIIKKAGSTGDASISLYITLNAQMNVDVYPQAFDLTQMFGPTIADYLYMLEQNTSGSGISKAKSWGYFLKDYYAHNAGRLLSVKTSEHKMTGFNQWDEVWEEGTFNTTTGENIPVSTQIRAKNLIPILGGVSYRFTCHKSVWMIFYDASKSVIPTPTVPGTTGTSNNSVSITNGVFTTPSNASYMRFYVISSYGGTYQNDICINLHWDGERDGEYEPYKEHSYALDSDLELRGIPKLDANNELYYDGDTYESNGTVTRKYGIVDLGSLSWVLNATNEFAASVVGAKGADYAGVANAVCENYLLDTYNHVHGHSADKTAAILTNSYLYVYDTAYTDTTAFKTAMSGVYLVYELATPTTETADPYQNPQIVDDWGTEEYVDTRAVPIPVGHETLYQANLKAKLEMAPNSPSDGDGDYIVRQTNGINEYVPLVIPNELPTMPSEDGSYRLKVTVTNGTPVLGWESIS